MAPTSPIKHNPHVRGARTEPPHSSNRQTSRERGVQTQHTTKIHNRLVTSNSHNRLPVSRTATFHRRKATEATITVQCHCWCGMQSRSTTTLECKGWVGVPNKQGALQHRRQSLRKHSTATSQSPSKMDDGTTLKTHTQLKHCALARLQLLIHQASPAAL